jgi:hypothetical protein
MRENRGPWYLLTGLVIGLITGLVYGWAISPVKYVDTSPVTLRSDYKDQFRILIASAFIADGDLNRAQSRLLILYPRSQSRASALQDSAQALTIQAQHALADGHPQAEVHSLSVLAVALSQGTASSILGSQTGTQPAPSSATSSQGPLTAITATFTRQPATPTPTTAQAQTSQPSSTLLPAPAFTPLPTRTVTPTPGGLFALQAKAPVCDPSLTSPLIIVQTSDAAGKPVPGVEIMVNWPDGEGHFFTGLKPELGLGYADYTMTPSTVYSLHLAGGGQPISGLITNECEKNNGDRYWGSWKLVFAQP